MRLQIPLANARFWVVSVLLVATALVGNAGQKKASTTPITPDWFVTFDNQESFDLFEVIDADNDGDTWGFSIYAGNYYARCKSPYFKEGDDWLVSPPLNLEAGVKYIFKYKVRGTSGYWETIETKIATGHTAPQLAAGTVIQGKEWFEKTPLDIEKEFTPTTSGTYYFGFHACSDPRQNQILLVNFSVQRTTESESPMAPTEFTATADPTGAQQATIKFKAPSLDINNNPLSTVSIEIRHNDQLATKLENVAAGSAHEWVDTTVPATGNVKFSAIAYVGSKKSEEVAATEWIGVDIPSEPANFQLKDQKTGILATWDPVTTGANGKIVKSDEITYQIYGFLDEDDEYYDPTRPTEKIADINGQTSYIIPRNTAIGDQQLIKYAVRGKNTAGIGKWAFSDPMIVGVPYGLPFSEPFSNDRGWPFASKFWYKTGKGYATVTNSGSADGDKNCLHISSFHIGENPTYTSGKIEVTADTEAILLFSHMNAPTEATLTVSAVYPDGSAQILTTIDLSEANPDWTSHKLSIPAPPADTEAQYIQLRFFLDKTGNDNEDSLVKIDKIFIMADPGVDLAISAKGPGYIITKGTEADLHISLSNSSADDLTGYTITLSADGQELKSETFTDPVPALATKDITMKVLTDMAYAASTLTVNAAVTIDGDQDATNNTAIAQIELADFDGRPVRELAAKNVNEGVMLTWTAPDATPQVITESFETYLPWTIDNFGAWTCVSNDDAYQGNIYGGTVKLPHESEHYAFILSNYKYLLDIDDMEGHSGQGYLSTFYGTDKDNTEGALADKWLISPRLSGNAQTVKFYTQNQNESTRPQPQLIMIYGSTSGTDLADFSIVAPPVTINGGGSVWQEVTADIPEGTTYFAIESRMDAETGLCLSLDDITCQVMPMTPAAYKIYRDDQLLNTVEPFSTDETPAYKDKDVIIGEKHTYAVTAVYNTPMFGLLESLPISISHTVAQGQDGISTVSDDASGQILSSDATRNNVYDMLGRLIRPHATTLTGLPAGIYIVNGHRIAIR